MDKEASPPSDPKTPSSSSPPSLASSTSENQTQEFASNFVSMYQSIFPPKSPLCYPVSLTPTTCSSSSSTSTSDDVNQVTEHRLYQARIILEYQALSDHYDLSLARLHDLNTEIESLRQENSELRLANTELVKILSHTAIQNRFHCSAGEEIPRFGPGSVIESNRMPRRNVDRVSVPKSISVRSSGYLTVKQPAANNGGSSRTSSRPQLASQFVSGTQQVYVPAGGKREEEAVEFEVYNQGMWKTELCNKWQETGACPYGDHCQFAHGITELRPVLRHPRYKTEVCKMVLGGGVCPYGHRCHFRHSLTEEERLLGHR